MKINEFKKGEIITRNEVAVYSCGRTDASFQQSQFEYIGSNEKIIVLIELNQYSKYGECKILTLDTNIWGKGWCKYPVEKIREAQLKLYAIAEGILLIERNEKECFTGKFKKGQLIKTCDNRYGFIKEIDWHSGLFLKRNDYQIQFPDGVGIFRADEIELVDNPPIK